jgi:hypothetical protein
MLMILFFIDIDIDEYLGKSVSSDMEIDEMSTSCFDMDSIGELDISFFELDTILLIETSADRVFIETTEYFFSFSFQSEVEFLSIELLLYLKCLFEAFTSLILGFFGIGFDFFKSVWSDFSGHSLWDQGVASLWYRYLNDSSLSSDMSDVYEEFDGHFVGRHIGIE